MKKFLVFLSLALLAGAAHADPISAVLSIGTMLSSGVAAVGIAGLTLTQGLMFAGGALGLAGAVTGNKKLRNLGGVLGLAGGLSELAKGLASSGAAAAGEAGSGAGAQQLAQTATTPAEQVAAEVSGQAGSEVVKAAGDVATADADAINAALSQSGNAPAQAATQAATPASESFRASANYGPGMVQAPASGGLATAAKNVGSFIKDNKELVQLGAGLIGGAMKSTGDEDLLNRRAELEQEAQGRYSASVTGIRQPGQFIRPGVDVTANRPIQNPIRYVPKRGLIQSARGA